MIDSDCFKYFLLANNQKQADHKKICHLYNYIKMKRGGIRF